MMAVADELGVECVFSEGDAEDAGIAVRKRAHGVEGVGGADGAGGDGVAGLGGGCVGVAERDADFLLANVSNEFGGAGKFGREGEQADVSARGLPEAVEEFWIGRLEMGGGMDSAAGVGDEGTFEMDADGARDGRGGVGGGLDPSGDVIERGEGCVDRSGDGGREVSGCSVTREERGHGLLAGGGWLHDVVSGAAVDVDVEESGGEECVAEVGELRAVRDGDGGARAGGGDE